MMNVVIADDFTGAAELAGIARRYDLNTEVQTKLNINYDLDVLIFDTNTRSENLPKAEEILTQVARKLATVQFDWLYKKTDSVLRGHVIPELKILMKEYSSCIRYDGNPVIKK